MIANIVQFVEIIVESRDKQRVVRKANVDRTQQKEQVMYEQLSTVVQRRI